MSRSFGVVLLNKNYKDILVTASWHMDNNAFSNASMFILKICFRKKNLRRSSHLQREVAASVIFPCLA